MEETIGRFARQNFESPSDLATSASNLRECRVFRASQLDTAFPLHKHLEYNSGGYHDPKHIPQIQ